MRTTISARREKFYRLVRQANEKTSCELLQSLQCTAKQQDRFNILGRLACLRILVCRDFGLPSPSGLPYPQRKKAVRLANSI